MSNFAQVEDSKVIDVIVADQEFIDTQPGFWVQTSYNSYGNVHYGPDKQPDGLPALRANYATIGGTYDVTNDVFYAAQPYPSWTISAPTWLWQAPVPYPSTGGPYVWDEATLSWVEV